MENCFVAGCLKRPSLVCNCKENMILCCLEHFGIHASENFGTSHSPMKIQFEVNDEDKKFIIKHFEKILYIEKSIREEILQFIQDINSECNKFMENSIKVCRKLKQIINDISRTGCIFELSAKEEIQNKSLLVYKDLYNIEKDLNQYKNLDWKYFNFDKKLQIISINIKKNLSLKDYDNSYIILYITDRGTRKTIEIESKSIESIEVIKEKIYKSFVNQKYKDAILRFLNPYRILENCRSLDYYQVVSKSSLEFFPRWPEGRHIFINELKRRYFSLDLPYDSTIKKVKSYIRRSQDYPPSIQVLYRNGVMLSDEITLRELGIKPDDNLQLELKCSCGYEKYKSN